MFVFKTAKRFQRTSGANSNIILTSKNKYQALSKAMKDFCDSVVTKHSLHQAEVHLQY